MANKVKFGLKNVHYAPITVGENGEIIFSTPKHIPGAVSLTLDAQGDEVEFEADDVIYYSSYSNTGYKGTLEMAVITDDFRKDILKDVEDENAHVLVEYANTEPAPFALLYEINGDQRATRRVLYYCTVSRPGENASTSGKTKTPKTDTMNMTAVPLADGRVRARTKENTVDEVFNNWYKAVWEPDTQEETQKMGSSGLEV